MFIQNGKIINLHGNFETPDGTRHSDLTRYPAEKRVAVMFELGIQELPDVVPPEDYSEQTYYKIETNEPPYVEYQRKPTELIQADRWERIKAHRDQLTIGNYGCQVQVTPEVVKWFHTDVYSKLQQSTLLIQALSVMMQGGPLTTLLTNEPWKTMDGTKVPMTAALAIAVVTAQVARDTALFGIAETKRYDDTPIYEGWTQTFVEYQASLNTPSE